MNEVNLAGIYLGAGQDLMVLAGIQLLLRGHVSSLEEKIDELLELERMNARNIIVLYRRTTALALMMDAIADQSEPKIPKAIRAEIDASLYPDEFERLAQEDAAEFTSRYGNEVLDNVRQNGIEGIMRVADFAPLKHKRVN